jgi:nucleoside-diphosphate-sugar epimerase
MGEFGTHPVKCRWAEESSFSSSTLYPIQQPLRLKEYPMNWKGRSVLVTGGTGFIGSQVVDALLSRGANVVTADQLIAPNSMVETWRRRFDNYLSIYKSHGSSPKLELIDLSVERDRLKHILVENTVDTVFMLSAVFGGRAFVDEQQAACSIGFAIDQNTIRACLESGTVKRITYSSSACVYAPSLNKPGYLLKESDLLSTGEGLASSDNLYGFQKITTELTLQAFSKEHHLATSSCRFLTVYGAGEFPTTHAISMLTERALRREDPFVVWGSGEQERGFTYVTDIVEGLILAAEKISDGTAVNLGWAKRYKIKDVVNMILEIVGYKPAISFDRTKPEGPLSRALDISLAKQLLGWEPKIDLRDGLQMTVDWMRTHYGEGPRIDS